MSAGENSTGKAVSRYISDLLEHEMKFHDVLKTTTQLLRTEEANWHCFHGTLFSHLGRIVETSSQEHSSLFFKSLTAKEILRKTTSNCSHLLAKPYRRTVWWMTSASFPPDALSRSDWFEGPHGPDLLLGCLQYLQPHGKDRNTFTATPLEFPWGLWVFRQKYWDEGAWAWFPNVSSPCLPLWPKEKIANNFWSREQWCRVPWQGCGTVSKASVLYCPVSSHRLTN